MAAFKGFGEKALPFFTALKFHQSKDWFEENRGLYESDVLLPMVALLDDLAERFAKAEVPLRADGRKSVFRLHRDVRFSKDKSPYKSHCGAVMTRSGAKGEQGLLYVHIAPDGCFVAAGFHMPEAGQLAALRNAIKAKPERFEAVVKALKKGKLALGQESMLTRVPRGFEDLKGGPLEDAVKLKSFIVEEPLDAAAIRSPKLVAQIEDFAKRALPLLEFGWAALG
jgi:uncharacterized protein (TIGR02453 family)